MNQNSDKMMDIKNIVLRFGGVVAIQNISFDKDFSADAPAAIVKFGLIAFKRSYAYATSSG